MSIKILNDEKKWFLETKSTAYVIGVDEDKNLQHLYWGEKFPYISDYPKALPQLDFPSRLAINGIDLRFELFLLFFYIGLFFL
ncbi:hypothetical protein ES705_15275 [subsurface metagenome]